MNVSFTERSEDMRDSSYYNKEGYPIPTHYYAAKNIEAEERERKAKLHIFRPIVYICSPLRGDVPRNIQNTRKYSRFAVTEGYLPLAPHLLFPQFMDDSDEDEREVGIHMGLVLLTKCMELWVFGDKITEGMRREIKRAKWRNIPVRYFTENLEEKDGQRESSDTLHINEDRND
uniref:N-deoxyribosyltransferase n=1 Tax=Siphoviridae sp. ctFSL3 TaxID=2825404 RepID=A0A8S5PCD0_9CAUD|nr:MAG TPA: N-deoxyribosyltransferase [Siphoviridae sp. ctFSL3]